MSKKNLLIVESASKAKTIQKYLNSIPELVALGSWEVMASLGHIMDLPSKQMGIDFETWKMTYMPLDKKKELMRKIKKAADAAQAVYLASDPDREGEAIADHLKRLVGGHKNVLRATFNEITKDAIKYAVLNPRTIDQQLVDAQETRRIMDRVVGYEASPLLWRRFTSSGLSAGRVQSAALCLAMERLRDIEKHETAPCWTIEGLFKIKDPMSALLHKDKERVVYSSESDMMQMIEALGKLQKSVWRIDVSQKESIRNAPPPLTTSSMQQEAYKKHGLPLKSTMRIAQSLYEEGFITYMRTDSTIISKDAQAAITSYVGERFGEEMVQPRQYASKAANAQEAHEAIRPTRFDVLSKDLNDLSPTHNKLYDLIWRRAVASQMKAAKYAQLTYSLSTGDLKGYSFNGSHDVLIERGYLEVLNPELKENPKSLDVLKKSIGSPMNITILECCAIGDVIRPPSLFTESTLVKALEKHGIGRPSTYASIIDKLFDKGYASKGLNPQIDIAINQYRLDIASNPPMLSTELKEIHIGGTETDRIVPSSLGLRVCDYLKETVPLIVEIPFTAAMETELDSIAQGTKNMKSVLDDFYGKFHGQVTSAQLAIKAAPKERKTKDASAAPTSTPTFLRTFPELGYNIVQTRFGMALFEPNAKKYYSIAPYMEWKKKEMADLSEHDVQFITSLPRAIQGTDNVFLEMGRYGLYLKKGANNYRLPRESWTAASMDKLDPMQVEAIVSEMTKKPKFAYKKKRT